MNDTGFLHLTNTTIQVVIFAMAALMGALLLRQFVRYGAHASEAMTIEDVPKFPMAGVFIKGFLLVVLLMGAFTINTWLPKAEVTAPAVNSTMQQQIYQDAERKVDVKPVTDASSADAEARATRVDEVRKQFDALPDDE